VKGVGHVRTLAVFDHAATAVRRERADRAPGLSDD